MSTEYKVIFSEPAKNDLSEIVAYIAGSLQSPVAAKNVLTHLKNEILSLSYFPKRYPLTEPDLFPDLEVRKVTVRNFSVYYHVNDSASAVSVLAVIYARKDQKAAINEMAE